MQVRHIYTPRDRAETCWTSNQPSKTRQGFKDECDINVIMARYQATGVIDFVTQHAPQYADVSGVDFQQAAETVAKARSMFADLPADLRARFSNDPGQFLSFINDDKNRAEAETLGLVRPAPKPAATAVAGASAPPAAPAAT